MKEEKTKSKKRLLYYLVLGICAMLLAAAIVLTVYFVAGGGGEVLDVPNDKIDEPDDPDDPVIAVDPNPYVAPVVSATYSMDYAEIYTNKTVGWIYRHYAIDFAADEGADVFAMADGTVTEVSYNTNTGNYVTIDHGNGLSSVYRFVEPVAGLGKGQQVKKGETIGKVSAAYGSEYKDGTHLHFEVREDDKPVDPTTYIEAFFEEK